MILLAVLVWILIGFFNAYLIGRMDKFFGDNNDKDVLIIYWVCGPVGTLVIFMVFIVIVPWPKIGLLNKIYDKGYGNEKIRSTKKNSKKA